MTKNFKATVLEVEQERFLYYRDDNKRDKWYQSFTGALPADLKVNVGDVYKCHNVIETDNGMFKSWRVLFEEV